MLGVPKQIRGYVNEKLSVLVSVELLGAGEQRHVKEESRIQAE